jgi:hypothetical protein
VLNFFGGGGLYNKIPPPSPEKRDTANNLNPPENNVFIIFSVIHSFAQSTSWSTLPFRSSIPPTPRGVTKTWSICIWNSDSVGIKSYRTTYFYCWGEWGGPRKLQAMGRSPQVTGSGAVPASHGQWGGPCKSRAVGRSPQVTGSGAVPASYGQWGGPRKLRAVGRSPPVRESTKYLPTKSELMCVRYVQQHLYKWGRSRADKLTWKSDYHVAMP